MVVICTLGFSPVTGSAISYYRSFDGTGNNQVQDDLGSVGVQFLRGSPSAPDFTATGYVDGVAAPARSSSPSPREISNTLSAQTQNMPSSRGISAMAWYWGQWIDHDITLTEVGIPNIYQLGYPQATHNLIHHLDQAARQSILPVCLRQYYRYGHNESSSAGQCNHSLD